jgi:hypothetical protein
MRFAEPVRGLADTNEALERLVQRGEVLLGEKTGDPAVDERDEYTASGEYVEVDPEEEATP